MVKFRHLLAALLLASLASICAFAQSSLTQIRDTITNPDGSLFNGMVVITWNGFSVPSGTPVSELSASAQIYNGALSVLLVPTTTATAGTYYSVVYSSSNGTVTWTETWQVPPSTTPLTLAQVRQSTTEGSGGTTTTGRGSGSGQYATLPLSISQVTNLSADLNAINTSITSLTTQVTGLAGGVNLAALQSTVTGLSSTVNGLTATVNSLSTSVASNSTAVTTLTTNVGTVTTTVSGLSTSLTNLTNTVTGLAATVNALAAGGTGSGGTSSNAFVDAETPGGSLNGANTSFTLANVPAPSTSFALYRNGLLQAAGVDYTLSGQALTFTAASTPLTGDILQASYRMLGTTATFAFVDASTPTGTINGTNLAFTLASTPNPLTSLKLFKNGLLLSQNGDYTVSGTTITFASTATTPQTGDALSAYYRH